MSTLVLTLRESLRYKGKEGQLAWFGHRLAGLGRARNRHGKRGDDGILRGIDRAHLAEHRDTAGGEGDRGHAHPGRPGQFINRQIGHPVGVGQQIIGDVAIGLGKIFLKVLEGFQDSVQLARRSSATSK